MTARTTTLRGADAGRYYVEGQLGYYLDSGEPRGVWRGKGAARLGLDGVVDEDDFLDLMAGVDPRTGGPLGTRHTERTVRGFDVTCSAPNMPTLPLCRVEKLSRQWARPGAVIGPHGVGILG